MLGLAGFLFFSITVIFGIAHLFLDGQSDVLDGEGDKKQGLRKRKAGAAIAFAAVVQLVSLVVQSQGCGQSYSEGSRAGEVIKLSHKGLFIKSWEGTLSLSGLRPTDGGTAANIWNFTVVEPEHVAILQKVLSSGERVEIKYKEWWSSPMRMGTDYQVVDVKAATPQSVP